MLNQINFTIRIGVFGCVSVGKSTLLKCLFGEDYVPSHYKRCTMIPQIYVETLEEQLVDVDTDKYIKIIAEKSKEYNKKIFEKSNSGEKIVLSDIVPISHKVPHIKEFFKKNDFNMPFVLEFVDIPGLDDSKLRDVYFSWVRQEFHTFDIILFVTSVTYGLNTSGEIDILNLITDCIEKEKIRGRNVFMIPIMNKCDDVNYLESGDFEFDDDQQEEMFDEACKTYNKALKEINYENTTSFLPFTATLSFIYRHIKENGIDVVMDKLSLENLNILGVHEVGKKVWSKIKDEKEKRNKLKATLSETNLKESLDATGFKYFRDAMRKIVKEYQIEFIQNQINNIINDVNFFVSSSDTQNNTKDSLHNTPSFDAFEVFINKIITVEEIYGRDQSQSITNALEKYYLPNVIGKNKFIETMILDKCLMTSASYKDYSSSIMLITEHHDNLVKLFNILSKYNSPNIGLTLSNLDNHIKNNKILIGKISEAVLLSYPISVIHTVDKIKQYLNTINPLNKNDVLEKFILRLIEHEDTNLDNPRNELFTEIFKLTSNENICDYGSKLIIKFIREINLNNNKKFEQNKKHYLYLHSLKTYLSTRYFIDKKYLLTWIYKCVCKIIDDVDNNLIVNSLTVTNNWSTNEIIILLSNNELYDPKTITLERLIIDKIIDGQKKTSEAQNYVIPKLILDDEILCDSESDSNTDVHKNINYFEKQENNLKLSNYFGKKKSITKAILYK
jgi:hypothetical protein